jgi:hypothetical protein
VFTPYYGAFQDTTTQTASAINTATPMLFNVTDFSNGVSIDSAVKSRIVFANAGVYNVQWSGQFKSETSNEHDATVWVRKNGTDIAGSAGKVLIAPKHGAINGHLILGWNYYLQVNANQYLELMWAVDDLSISIGAFPSSGYAPSTASLIVTAHQVG